MNLTKDQVIALAIVIGREARLKQLEKREELLDSPSVHDEAYKVFMILNSLPLWYRKEVFNRMDEDLNDIKQRYIKSTIPEQCIKCSKDIEAEITIAAIGVASIEGIKSLINPFE